MKKTILTIMVVAMMLVAFTACEQPVPGLSKAIVDADIVQNGTFFVGQPFDASKFSVNVTYSDGSKGTLAGVNVVYAGDNTDGTVSNGDKVTIKLPVAAPNYSGNDAVMTSTVTFEGSVVAYAFNNVTVTGTESLPYDTTEDEFVGNLELSVVATYKDSEGATQSVTLVEDEDYAVGEPTATTEPSSTADGVGKAVIVLKYGGYKLTGVSANNVEYEFVATLYEEPDPVYTYKWDGKTIAFALAEESSSNAYIERGLFKTSMVTVYKVLDAYTEDGEAAWDAEKQFEAIPASDIDIYLASGSTLAGTSGTSARFNDTTGKATVEFDYTFVAPADEGTGKRTTFTEANLAGMVSVNPEGQKYVDDSKKTIEITLRDDYPTSFSATWLGKGGVSGTAYNGTSGETPSTSTDFSYSVTWASNYTAQLTKDSGKYFSAISCSAIDAGTSAGSHTVVLTYDIDDADYGYTNSDTTAEVSVQVTL